jgi:alpha-glucoside transport system permease protein
VNRAGSSRRKRFAWDVALIYGFLTGLVLIWTIPTVGLLVTSLRSQDDSGSTGWWTVLTGTSKLTTDNYAAVLGLGADASSLGGIDLARSFLNSLLVTVPSTFIPLLLAALAAYAFAWMRFAGRALLYGLVVALLVVPVQVALVPILRDYNNAGLLGSVIGVWLIYTGFGLAFATYLLYNFIVKLPKDMFESAVIDGASHFLMFTKIVIPLSIPAFAAFAIFQFLSVWNGVLIPLYFLGKRPDLKVLPQRLLEMLGAYGSNWHLLTAGAFVSLIMPLLVFVAFQRYFVRGLTAGAVKG